MGGRLRSIVVGLGLSAASILLTLVVLEVVLRTGRAAPRAVRSTEVESRASSRMVDPDFRQPGFSVPDKQGAFRILVVGDSFAWGDGVHREGAFPRVLESRLEAVSRGDRFEVINWSRPGWNTLRQLRSLEPHFTGLDPDLFILSFVLNDPEPVDRPELEHMLSAVVSRVPAAGPSAWLLAHSRLYSLIWNRLENRRMHRELSAFYRGLFVGEQWETCRRALRRMRNLARRNRVPMVLVIFPVFDSPMDERYLYADLHEKVSKEAEALRIPVLDLLGTYWGMDTRRLAVVPFSNAHPSEIGHRVAAEGIRDFLIRRRLIPRVAYKPKPRSKE